MSEIETKKYTITGLVDFNDEQGNIAGQFEIGSVQELPVEVGDAAVADGRAEAVEGSEQTVQVEDVVEDAPTGETGAADDTDKDEDEEEKTEETL